MKKNEINLVVDFAQILCNHVKIIKKNWRFLYKYALTCYYLSDYLKGVNKYAARYS